VIVRRRPPLHLTYCLNVHRGERWPVNLEAIRTHALSVRERVAPGRAFGLGLRLSRAAADELGEPAPLAEFRRFLAGHELYVFTINGFPYGDFHDTAVKENVYAPDWRSEDRLAYTTRLADILAELLPEDTPGSISTVPGSYRAWMHGAEDTDAIGRNLARCAEHLHHIEATCGRHIMLALEPEPDCLFDTTAETVAFFNTVLAGHPAIRRVGGDWRRYIGVCLDTCHISVQFEDPAESLLELRRNGIEVPKVHLSAALRACTGPSTASLLGAFAEGVYLHQVRLRRVDGSVLPFPDLTKDALGAVAREADGEVRVHVHVPLYFEESGSLRSTAAGLSSTFFRALSDAGLPHLEIETYTFNVLPPDLARRPLTDSIVEEYRWTRHHLGLEGP